MAVVVVGSVAVVVGQERLQSVRRREGWRRVDGTIVAVGTAAVGKGAAAVGTDFVGSEAGAAVAAGVSVVGMRVGERRWRAFSGLCSRGEWESEWENETSD